MTDPSDIPLDDSSAETGLTKEYIHDIREAIGVEDVGRILELTDAFHASDTAELLGLISRSERETLILALGEDFDPETLTYLDDEVSEEILSILGTEKAAEALTELETDDAVQVIEDLEAEEQQELLQAIEDTSTRADLREGLGYEEDSAGRLMQKRFVAAPEFWNVGDVIDHLRQSSEELPEEFYEVIVVDPRYHPIGTVMISRIMQNQRETAVRELMKENLHPIPTDMDQEEVAHLFRRYGLVEAPVINHEGRIVGVITVDDVVDVIKEEEEEDYLRAGGIIDRDFHAGLFETVKGRIPWLAINLFTAMLASWVISFFETTIEQWVTLAVLMPIIASITGNAGMQSVTISVRAIATRELQSHNARPVIIKEIFANLLSGIILSVIMSVLIIAIYGDFRLAFIFSGATIATHAIAGFSGAIIPLLLNKFKIDPAIASSIFLTTLTDMLSFFLFLGLAAWMVL